MIDPLTLFIDSGAQKHPTVISIVSAGGEISLLLWLTELSQASGRRILITTTTHMFMSASHWPTAFCRDPVMLPHASFMFSISFCFHCWKANQGKVQGFTPGAIDALIQRPECGVVLIEANGSHEMPLKAPDEHESRIPRSGCYVTTVMGGRISGARASTENVHRWLQFTDITGLTPDVPLRLSGLVALVRHPQRAFKNIPQNYRRVWFINRFSQCENAIAQSGLLQPLQQHSVETIWLGSTQEHPAIARRFVNQRPRCSGLLKGYPLRLV